MFGFLRRGSSEPVEDASAKHLALLNEAKAAYEALPFRAAAPFSGAACDGCGRSCGADVEYRRSWRYCVPDFWLLTRRHIPITYKERCVEGPHLHKWCACGFPATVELPYRQRLSDET